MNSGEVNRSAPREPKAAAAWLAVTVIGLGLLLMGFRALYDQFDADELQHSHIAWLIAQGKVPYRDFWDHHGPLYGLAIGALIRLTEAAPGMDLMIGLRFFSTALAAVMLALTYGLARTARYCPRDALLAAALLASLYFFQDVATEIRPDPLQNVFWLAGLYVFCANLVRRRAWVSTGAGILFGLAALTNLKAVLGPALMIVFLLVSRHMSAAKTLTELLRLVGGALIPYAVVIAYFAINGAVADFHQSNILFNLIAVSIERNWTVAWSNARFLLSRQLPFVVVAGAGLWFVARNRDERPGEAGATTRKLLAVVGVATAACWVVNDFYPQWWLVCMPLLCVVAASGFNSIATAIASRVEALSALRPGPLSTILAAAAIAYLLGMAAARTPFREHPNLVAQRHLTDTILREIPRSEPLGVIWSSCGGYMFNDNLQYWWALRSDIGVVAQRYSGEDVNGQAWIARLESGRVKFIVGRRDAIHDALPEITRNYLREHYYYEDCLWRRRM